MPGRFLRSRDLNFFDTVNKELIGDPKSKKNGVINQEVVVYKISTYETQPNLYGESSSGRVYKNGIKLACIIEAADFDYEVTEFGPDLNQDGTFSFLRQSLIDVDFVPEIGDVIEWNYAYWEINEIQENQLIGGMQENNHSVICNAYLSEQSRVGLERIRAH